MIEEATFIAELEQFVAGGLITDVLHAVKSGKEGTVYCCRAHPSTGVDYLAAKVYRPRHLRTFKNDAVYQEGRVITDKRLQRAFDNKSRKGREVQAGSWVAHEAETLEILHAAGTSVPRLVAQAESALLMEYVGNGSEPAPPLRSVRLEQAEVMPLLDQVLNTIEVWLSCDRVHGDLSPYNILYHEGRLVFIDFPQAVDPRFNLNAFDLLVRDMENALGYWERYGVRPNAPLLARDLWRRFTRAML